MSEFSYLKYDVYFYLLSHSQICYYEKNEGNDIPTNLVSFLYPYLQFSIDNDLG